MSIGYWAYLICCCSNSTTLALVIFLSGIGLIWLAIDIVGISAQDFSGLELS
jgi:hypothetical protein